MDTINWVGDGPSPYKTISDVYIGFTNYKAGLVAVFVRDYRICRTDRGRK